MTLSARFVSGIHLCSVLVFLYSITMIVPILVGVGYGERPGDIDAFVISLAIPFLAGGIGAITTRHRRADLRNRDGFWIVVLFWLLLSLVSALPFMFDERLHMNLVDALFEAISGLTTTGASVISGLDSTAHSILYYRAQLNFFGGLGIIVLAVAVLPMLDVGGSQLYRAETPGPMKDERLTPRLADTAKHLWLIYVGLATACAVAFRVAGMNWFDAVCHSLATLALGGFSTHDASIGYFHSGAIEVVAGVFSILAAVNFGVHFRIIRQRSLRPLVTDSECLFLFAVLGILVAITCAYLYFSHTFDLRASLYHGFFQAISVITDNGLGTVGYPNWSPGIALMLILGSFFGGCVGSTCGGIKAMRFLLLFKQAGREVRQLVHPNGILAVRVNGRRVQDRVMQAVWGFFFLYIGSYCLFVVIMVFTGTDIVTSFGTTAACMNNMGLGFGATATGFGGLNIAAKWTMCVAMLAGRLEIFPILVLLSGSFWRF